MRGVAAPCRIHAARNVDECVGRRPAVEHAVRNKGFVVEGDVPELSAARGDEDPAGHLHRDASVLHFPAVGDSVHVGVDRAGVHAAAAEAHGGDVGGQVAIDKAEVRVDLVVGEPDRVVCEHDAPCAALERVLDAVSIGVVAVLVLVAGVEDASVVRGLRAILHCARICREELVPPSLRLAWVVFEDRFAAHVRIAGVDAGVLLCPAELVVVMVDVGNLGVLVVGDRTHVRVAVHVELPAVGHRVEVGVGAVRRDGRLVAARLVERLGHGLCDFGGGGFFLVRRGRRRGVAF